MKHLTNSILRELKKGSIQNVELFSDTDVLPKVPYVIVKPEVGAKPDTWQFRIIAHHSKGAADKLAQYIFTELTMLLSGTIDDDEGSRYKLYNGGITAITAEPNDNTYFMERVFYTPLMGYGI